MLFPENWRWTIAIKALFIINIISISSTKKLTYVQKTDNYLFHLNVYDFA